MAYRDLREFIEALESKGLLKRIKAEVDPDLEITEITDRVSKMKGEKNVALLFENVKDSKMPVLMNAFGSYERMAMALGVEKLDDVADELREMMKLPYVSLQNKMSVVTMIPMIKRAINFPKYVKHAPCQEVVETENPNLDEIPILKCWPDDGGPFVTLPLVFTKNPKTGKRNVGMYRLQKYDSKTTGMHWHIHKNGAENFRDMKAQGGERIEAAVAIGTDPVVTYAATAPLPRDIDEMVFAGFLRHKSVEMVKCKTVDIEVPATAEIIHRSTTAELQAAFGAYLPGCAESDFYEMELGTAGMMRGYMARRCDQYFTLERKIRRFLGMSLSVFQVPEQEREQIIAFAAKIDVRAEARKVMDALFESLSVQFELKEK